MAIKHIINDINLTKIYIYDLLIFLLENCNLFNFKEKICNS